MNETFQLTADAMFFNAGQTLLPALSIAGAAAATGLATLSYGIINPRTSLFGKVISRGTPQSTGIAITLDDGPTPGATERVLDILGEHQVRAAFFVIGRNAERWPKLVERMDQEGHIVENHTYEHSHTGCLNRYAYWEKELPRANDAIEQIIGKRPALFRPPMGLKTWHLLSTAKKLGLTTVTWTRRAKDARMTTHQDILDRLSAIEPRDVLLLHDGTDPHGKPRNPEATCEALGPLISSIKERGLKLTRLDEVIEVAPYASTAPKYF